MKKEARSERSHENPCLERIAGRNAVLEALKSGRAIDKLYIQKGGLEGTLVRIAALAKEAGIPVKEVDRVKLDFMAGNEAHQGVVATGAVRPYADIEDLLAVAELRNEDPFIIVVDGVEDPHNLGAIIRSADGAGAHGVIIHKYRAVGLTYGVAKASAGAVEHVKVARVSNISTAIQKLKDRGLWVYGAHQDAAESCFNTDLTGKIALVVGSEGRGISPLVAKHCDRLVSIPMKGKMSSLNVSVAAGILMYEVLRQRDARGI